MKKLFCLLIVTILVGCASTPTPEVRIVTVDKPIPMCPIPPTIPTIEYEVDKLTNLDKVDPGKVGQAYKYDMLYLRNAVRLYQMILDEYKKTSGNFDQVKLEIDKVFKAATAPTAASDSTK